METLSTETSSQGTESIDLVSAQGITGPTDAELRGETSEPEAPVVKTQEDDTTVVEKVEEEPAKVEGTPATEEKPAISEPKVDKPPTGYVPLEAVHQARGEIKYLKEQLQSVQDQMRSLQTPPKPVEVAEDFEVLTDDQFEVLAEDDPTQAAIYLRKLNLHDAKMRSDSEAQRKQAEFAEAYDRMVEAAVTKIEQVAPGIYDENSAVQKELMEFAEGLGFTEDLYYLTNPTTKVILPGETEPLLLGEQAASILGMLVSAKTKTAAPDTTALEAKLRTEITEELMKKFKTPDTEAYRGLGQVPKTDMSVPTGTFEGKVLSTEQLLKLSPADYEKYLSGN